MTSVRIATLNLWNSDNSSNSGHLQIDRLHAAAEELTRLDADVVALQEVRSHLADGEPSDAATFLQERIGSGYGFMVFRPYPGNPGEGLAFLSRHPLRITGTGLAAIDECALRVIVDIGDVSLALTNLHLDWRSVLTREHQIVDIMGIVTHESDSGCYEFLLGDFNSRPESSVYQFLAGQRSLHGQAAVAWHDLARTWAERSGFAPAATLDFGRNPRWKDAPTLDRPARVDWILVRDTFAAGLVSPSVTGAGIFGDEPTPIARVVPSDHYGVFADLLFPDGESQDPGIP